MLDFDTAQSQLATAGPHPSRSETVSLTACNGRVLAQAVQALFDLPPASNSAMDGYALRFSDYQAGLALPIQQRCYAGDTPQALQAGQAIRLFTGSLLPEGADTIVMQENAKEEDDHVTLTQAPVKGSHIRHQGEDVSKSTELFSAGTVLGAPEIALLAAQGIHEVSVYSTLKIGILTTGDELVEPGKVRSEEQIYNSNAPMLAAMVTDLGFTPAQVIHATDTPDSIRQAFETLLEHCDLVLTVGGVSVGEKDLVKPTIEALGGSLDLWRVRMKPGRPVALARINTTPIVCLPGNPVSAFVVFMLLVTPLIRHMQGCHTLIPSTQQGRLKTQNSYGDSREEFLRVQMQPSSSGLPALVPHHDQGSAIISSLAWAQGLARIPIGHTIGNNDTVAYYDFSHWLRLG